ncbi:MAG: molecular chaperone DnaK [Planctomycetia bacterium]|nr:molecular chaperone DnaK [Planctomycetia bacterium]
MGKVQFHRVAVGNHLMLGGDNLDLALAHFLEKKLEKKLSPRQWGILVRVSRQVKEDLLGENPPESWRVTLPGSSSKLIGGSLHVEVTRQEVEEMLLEGFFPRVTLNEKPLERKSGFQEFGLPYAPDSAITRYLAAFLSTHRFAGEDVSRAEAECFETEISSGKRSVSEDPARPDVILYNGGLFESPILRERLTQTLTAWFSEENQNEKKTSVNLEKNNGAPKILDKNGGSVSGVPEKGSWRPKILENDRLDLAVARGAAYYGLVRRGKGVRIAAGLARTYYVRVNSEREGENVPQGTVMALCLVPAKVLPGEDVILADKVFRLKVGMPVEFPLYVSSVRLTDMPGEIVMYDPQQMTELPPIRTILKKRRNVKSVKKDEERKIKNDLECPEEKKEGDAGKESLSERGTEEVRIHLHARLTEIGTLELWCDEVVEPGQKRRPQRWQLEFDVRSATRTEVETHFSQAESEGVVDEVVWEGCQRVLKKVFSSGSEEKIKPAKVMDSIKRETQIGKNSMPASLLRRIWAEMMELEKGREFSAEHEARWLNLLGFSLRPGFGYAMDDWRVAETWKRLQGKLIFPSVANRSQWWILWRRIAGGLNVGQQLSLAQPLLSALKSLHHHFMTGRGKVDFHFQGQETNEILRLLGSLELLPVSQKEFLGEMLLDMYRGKRFELYQEVMAWTLGRLASRTLMTGTLDVVLSPTVAEKWLKGMRANFSEAAKKAARKITRAEFFAIMQVARRTDDRYRDVNEAVRSETVQWMKDFSAPEHLWRLVEQGGALSEEEKTDVFGESLPPALILENL